MNFKKLSDCDVCCWKKMQIRTQSSGGRCRASGFDSSVRVDSTTFRRLRVKLRGRGGDTPAATFVWIRTGSVQAQAQSHGRASLSGRRRSERQMFRTTATTGAFFFSSFRTVRSTVTTSLMLSTRAATVQRGIKLVFLHSTAPEASIRALAVLSGRFF